MPFWFLARLFACRCNFFLFAKNQKFDLRTLFVRIFSTKKKLHHFVIVSSTMDKHNLLHPPLPVKNLKKKDEVLLINGTKEDGNFIVTFIDADFIDLPKPIIGVPVKDLSKFLGSHACRNVKAVFFVFVNFENASHVVNLEIRQMVYEEVRKRKWHLYLIHPSLHSTMLMVFGSKIISKPGDILINVICSGETGEMVTVSELHRKQEGYSYIGNRRFNRFNRNINDVATEILGTCDPKYVIVLGQQCNGLVMSLKDRFIPSKNVIYIDHEGIVRINPQVLKTIFDHESNQIIPFSMDKLAVSNESNFTDPEQAVITVDYFEELPFEKVQIVPKSKKPYYVVFYDTLSDSYKPAGKAELFKEKEGHRIKLALIIDSNSLPFLYQEAYLIPEIQSLPKKLASSKANLNVPVIAFFDNSSVICVRDENGYKFLNEWNGLYGNDLYLSFEPEEPTIVTDFNKVKDKDPFVVYDLVKVLSMPANILKIDPKWGFKVTSDAENPVLLEVETFLGIRKSATPVFLMALFLKHHIKAIKKVTGKKPKELGFCIFSDFTKKEKKRIKSGLEEACKLLKIGFVTNV